jgi:hypothetical protein
MPDLRKECRVVLAIDVKARNERRKEYADRLRRETAIARQGLEQWLRERDPEATVQPSPNVTITPILTISTSEKVVNEMHDLTSRPPMIKTIDLINPEQPRFEVRPAGSSNTDPTDEIANTQRHRGKTTNANLRRREPGSNRDRS